MAILHTQINTRSPEFAANSAAMLEQVADLRALLARPVGHRCQLTQALRKLWQGRRHLPQLLVRVDR